MTFDDWFYDQFDRPREAAEEAWNYQQERIDELEDQVDGLEDELHCVRAHNDELITELKKLKRLSSGQANGGSDES